jgi:hypothetical protein
MGKTRRQKAAARLSQYPLSLAAVPPARIHRKSIASLMQSELDAMLKPTSFGTSNHFVQRISQKKGRDRWQSFGISNIHDLWLSLRAAWRKPGTQVESDSNGRLSETWTIEQGAALLIVNPADKRIVTITFPK